MPHVVTHNAVSIDGRIDGFEADVGTYYDLAGRFDPDAHLTGSDTLIEGLASTTSDTATPDAGEPSDEPDADPPALVVPDSRGRIDDWGTVRAQPFGSRVVVLCSATTPASYLATLDAEGIAYHVAGDDHVDYRLAFNHLAEHDDFGRLLVDSGGTLSGHLFRAGLVDEVSVLVHPAVVGGASSRSFVRGPDPVGDGVVGCSLASTERLDGGLLWLRYDVVDG